MFEPMGVAGGADDTEGDDSWHIEIVEHGVDVVTFGVSVDGRSASRLEFWRGLARSGACREALTNQLRELPMRQIYWETPALSNSTAAIKAEFAAVAAGLVHEQNCEPFEQFLHPGQPTATFDNLRGDALLVAPTDQHPTTRYNYLMSFLRSADPDQIHAVWTAVGRAALRELDEAPIWVSTAGGGVPWLHFRIDSRPKYYRHAPYRRST